ncbi:hypothetical protein EYF80_012749 [Liparis tanakae]|uniref:Uncharacterized protein n=1 Tax=Liparis tanakae TaxID=230148 RepID=A0A4Z2IHB2_9TELE|nr:hypothetical protein EYF80_012749 [Liparis tanakae]
MSEGTDKTTAKTSERIKPKEDVMWTEILIISEHGGNATDARPPPTGSISIGPSEDVVAFGSQGEDDSNEVDWILES